MALPNTNPTYEYIGGAFGDGTVFGQTSASLMSFWGASPSVRVAFTQAAVATTAPSSTLAVFAITSAQTTDIIALVNEIRAAMVSMGLKS